VPYRSEPGGTPAESVTLRRDGDFLTQPNATKMPLRQTAEKWMEELRSVAVEKFEFTKEAAKSLKLEDWEPYFIDGLTPEQALKEDLFNA